MICLALHEPRIEAMIASAVRHAPAVDVFEIHADTLESAEVKRCGTVPRLLAARGLTQQVVLVLRPKHDGGGYAGPDDERAQVLESAVSGAAAAGMPFFAVELEEGFDPPELRRAAEAAGTEVIRVICGPDRVPDDLASRVHALSERREIVKISATVTSTADLIRLFRGAALLGEQRKIIDAKGSWGVPAVVLAGKFGALYTVSRPGPGAPGGTDPAGLVELYRYRHIVADTPVFAVIGNPILHSRSPHYHNRRFADDRRNAVYVPIQVDRTDDFFELADLIGLAGASVTIPHKESVIPFLASCDQTVAGIGACNTIVRSAAGSEGFIGTNTDVPGFLHPLLESLGRSNLEGLRATVVGAGGAARGVVYALLSSGASVCVLNRTESRARELRRALLPYAGEGRRFEAGPLDYDGAHLAREFSDIVVQTTSVGMHPNEGQDPFPAFDFSGHEVVCDIIYTPEVTAFLERARSAGCRTFGGRAMFDAQAAEQYDLFVARTRSLDD